MEEDRLWHKLSLTQVYQKLNSSEKGLSDEQAAERLAEYGHNELKKFDSKSVWKMLIEQLSCTAPQLSSSD